MSTLKSFSLAKMRNQIIERSQQLQDRDGPFGCFRQGDGHRPDLYASLDFAMTFEIIGIDLKSHLTDDHRQQWIDHINSYAHPFDGHYKDRLYGHSPLHGNGMVISALGVLGGKQARPCLLYEPFDTADKVCDWLEQVNWKKQWGASHHFWGGMIYFSFSKHCPEGWVDRVVEWLNDNLEPDTGFWRKGVAPTDWHQPIGGAVHIIPIYQHHQRPFPLSKVIIDTLLQIQKPDGAWTHDRGPNMLTYFELDVLYLLLFHRQQCPGYRDDDIRQAVERFGEVATRCWSDMHEDILHSHPHNTLAAASTFGLLQQLLPDILQDEYKWTDIFSTRRFYQTEKVEADPQ